MSEKSVESDEILLTVDRRQVRVSPFGASLRGFHETGEDGKVHPIVTGYSGTTNKVGGQGDVLIPFPGRIRDGRYSFDGNDYALERNDKDGPNAIHGFLRTKHWETTERTDDMVRFSVTLGPEERPGYPFALMATVRYSLTPEEGLTCAFKVTNTGDRRAPVAAGFHPYFTVGTETIDDNLLYLPFESYLEFENLLPTGEVSGVGGTSFDFRSPRPIGTTVFNTCFADPVRDTDGFARVRLSSADGGRTITVRMDEAFGYVVLYSGDPLPETHRRRSLAIEPMTCASDGFNRPEWGLARLEPGETLTGVWGVL
ncbi:MAG: hypothetical protein SFU56_05145 [Capsulimonadales bacterium]|nr:hypothetical protein [Capsulimonadales bacterium]